MPFVINAMQESVGELEAGGLTEAFSADNEMCTPYINAAQVEPQHVHLHTDTSDAHGHANGTAANGAPPAAAARAAAATAIAHRRRSRSSTAGSAGHGAARPRDSSSSGTAAAPAAAHISATEKEDRIVGRVSGATYMAFCKHGGWLRCMLVVVLMCSAQAAFVMSDW